MLTIKRKSRGFSLIELVVVVVILGVIAAIAIPRMSRGAAGAADSGLASDLSVLRNAIEMYKAEHAGSYPTAADIGDQLTLYTDISGNTSSTKTGAYIYGPYIAAVPALKVGANRGNTDIAAADAAGVGWIYTATTGSIVANAAESDESGTAYASY